MTDIPQIPIANWFYPVLYRILTTQEIVVTYLGLIFILKLQLLFLYQLET